MKQHSALPQFPKDQAHLVKLELVNLVLEIGAPLHAFHKIAQWLGRQGQLLRSHIREAENPCMSKQQCMESM
jgi:hypothetical protein